MTMLPFPSLPPRYLGPPVPSKPGPYPLPPPLPPPRIGFEQPDPTKLPGRIPHPKELIPPPPQPVPPPPPRPYPVPRIPGGPPPPIFEGDWEYGEEQIGGRSRQYWEENPEEYMLYIMGQSGRGMSQDYKRWLQNKAYQMSALWNAYRTVYNQEALQTHPAPLGDWLMSMLTGQGMPWQTPGWQSGGQLTPERASHRFWQYLAQQLTGPGRGGPAEQWREAASEDRGEPALLLSLLAGGYAPSVMRNVMYNSRDWRAQYGGIGEGEFARYPTYADWIMNRLRGAPISVPGWQGDQTWRDYRREYP